MRICPAFFALGLTAGLCARPLNANGSACTSATSGSYDAFFETIRVDTVDVVSTTPPDGYPPWPIMLTFQVPALDGTALPPLILGRGDGVIHLAKETP